MVYGEEDDGTISLMMILMLRMMTIMETMTTGMSMAATAFLTKMAIIASLLCLPICLVIFRIAGRSTDCAVLGRP